MPLRMIKAFTACEACAYERIGWRQRAAVPYQVKPASMKGPKRRSQRFHS